MKVLLAVACGGAAGATARYLVFVTSSHLFGHGFPFGTLIVNIFGSFLLGVLAEGMALAWTVPASLRLFLVVGFLGAFTTFSTFSLDVVVLYERGQILRTLFYIVTSFVLSVGGLFAGLMVMRRLLAA
jgi:CrcB protein